MHSGYQTSLSFLKKYTVAVACVCTVLAVFTLGLISTAHAQTLPAGTYTVTVTGPDGSTVATGSLIVNASGASQTVCPAGTTGTFPSCVPVGLSGIGISAPTSAGLVAGDRVLTVVNANVRNAASITGTVLGVQTIGSLGTMNDVVPVVAGAHTWISVNFDSGADGWTAMANVEKVSTGSSGLIGQAPTCPAGTAGTYPNCVAPGATTPSNQTSSGNTGGSVSAATTCPFGTTGTFPNCVAVGAPTTQTGLAPSHRMQTTSNLNVRSTPSTSSSLIGVQPVGATGLISAGPVTADGYTWFYVNFDTGVDGWAVSTYMQEILTAPSAQILSCPAGLTGTAPNCVLPTATQSTPLLFALRDRVKMVANFMVTLWYYPTLVSNPVTLYGPQGNATVGAVGTVIDGPRISNGHISYYVRFDTGQAGWIAQEYLAPSNIAAPPGTSVTVYPPPTPNTTNLITAGYAQTTGTNISTAPIGSKFFYACSAKPTGPTAQTFLIQYFPVYGGTGGVYSTDSDICASAVQAGIITSENGGTVIVQTVPWQAVTGTSANGITSTGTSISGPAYTFASLAIGAASPARITNVTPLSGVSPLSTIFTVSNIPIGQINAYTLNASGPDGRIEDGYTIGSYVLDQVNQAFVTEGTKTLTFRTPGTYTIKLMQTVVSGLVASQNTLDTKTVTVTAPPPVVTVTHQVGQPLYVNFAFTWLEPGTYTLDDGSGTSYAQANLGYVANGNVSIARNYPAAGTYTARLLKDGITIITEVVTVP